MATLPLRGKSLGNPDDAAARAIARGGKQPDHIRRYARSLWDACARLGVRADVAFAQADLETGDRSTGVGFRSDRWVNEGNPAGISIVTGMPDGTPGPVRTPEAWGIIHATHLGGYAGITPPDEWKEMDIRWDAMIRAGYFGVAETVDDLDQRWAWDPRGSQDYGGKIEARWRLYDFPAMTTTPDPQPGDNGGNDMATHRYIISMGHRNTDRGGAYREYDWTPGAARALRDAIKARGGQAWIIQEERGNGNFYNGGLQAAARACVDLARSLGPFDAYISMHYDSSPGFHAIYPNGANDTKAMNPLDVRLCEAMAKRVAATKTVRMKTWPSHGVGVMDEKETYVGSQGYRLGEFVGTLGFRDTTARVITEASGVGDDKYLHDPKWVRNVYAEALVDALEDVFGKFKGTKPEPQPEPEPEPEYEKADPIEEVAALPFYVKLDNGAQMVRADLSVKAKNATPRRKWAHPQSPKIGPDIPAGEAFKVDYLVINADGSLYWYTPWATRVTFEDTEPIVTDVDKPDAADVIDAVRDVVDDAKG